MATLAKESAWLIRREGEEARVGVKKRANFIELIYKQNLNY